MSSKTLNIVSSYLLALIAIAFVLFYLLLSYYNRPASDDIVFAAFIKKINVLDGVTSIYHSWSGRWTSYAYLFSVLSVSTAFQNLHYYIFLYHCVTLLILIYSVNTILRTALSKVFEVSLGFRETVVYSILFIAGLYYSTFQHIEVWWWITASFHFLQGITFLLFGTALILREQKNFLHYLLIALSFIYVGGCFEIYAVIIFCLFLSIIINYSMRRGGFNAFREKFFFKGFVVAFLSFSLSAMILFAASGNMKRIAPYVGNNTSTSITKIENTLTVNKDIVFQKKNVLALSLASLFVLMGIKLKTKSTKKFSSVWKTVLIASFPFLISIVITLAFQFFILNGKQVPLRAWTFTSFSLFGCCCILFLLMGYYVHNTLTYSLGLFKSIIPLLILIVVTSSIYKQYKHTSNYAGKYDELIFNLMKEKENKSTKTYYVSPLPNSGMLVYLYLDSYAVTPLKEILELDFEIIPKEN